MRRLFLSLCMGILAFGGSAPGAAQQEPDRQQVLEKLEDKMRAIRHMAFHPAIVRAVRIQNQEQLDLALIQQRDSEWRSAQQGTELQRTIAQDPASRILETLVERSPYFSEAFATDNQGANVAMFPVTSDYWQGDEDKWSQAFNDGDGRRWVGDIEVDESTGVTAVQVSVPVLDQGETIGVLVVGITEQYLQE